MKEKNALSSNAVGKLIEVSSAVCCYSRYHCSEKLSRLPLKSVTRKASGMALLKAILKFCTAHKIFFNSNFPKMLELFKNCGHFSKAMA